MTPADLRTLADRIAKDPRLGQVARNVTASVLEGGAARVERGDW